MKQLICFGDSNTWGYNGETKTRLPWGERWTSLLQEKLAEKDVRVVEEGLCGRTTIFDDPLRIGRKGSDILPVVLETHASADGLILMLGTNDCKTVFNVSAHVIASGIEKLLDQITHISPETKILLVSPITLGENVWKEEFDPEFSKESVQVSRELAVEYAKLAAQKNIAFLDAASVVVCSQADQEHMDAKGHRKLADAVYDEVEGWF